MENKNLLFAMSGYRDRFNRALYAIILFSCCFFFMDEAQGQTGSPALQAFDYVADGSGNKFRLLDINVDSPNPFGKNTGGGTTTVNSAASCQAGYFTLHYNPTSFLSSNTNSLALQNVICQVFSDISNLIISPLSAVTNSAPIHILCSNLNASGYAATGEAIFAYPNNPINPNQGFILSEVQRSIQSGLPPYSNLSAVSAPAAASFYAGYLDISPTIN